MCFTVKRGFCVVSLLDKCEFPGQFDRLILSWENMTHDGEAGMPTAVTKIDQMIVQLNEFILPSSLMESFDLYREESVKTAARCFTHAQLSWFLDMLNRFRRPEDRKDSLVDIFDPGMYTFNHPAWEAAPGTRIEMPALTSEVAGLVDRNSEFAAIAQEEINEFRNHAETYAEDEIVGLARIAAAALADPGRAFRGCEDAICYLALNASALLEDLWATDDTSWINAPVRKIQFDDMVAKRKADLLNVELTGSSFEESDFACYPGDEIRRFALDIRSLFLTGHAKHLAICTRCQRRLEAWTRLVDRFDKSAACHDGRANA